MKGSLKIIPVIVLVVLTSISGCITPDDIVAAEIKADMIQSINDVTTYSFSVSQSTSMTLTSEIVDGSTTATGIVDISNKKFSMIISMILPEIGETISEIYIFNDLSYIKNQSQGNIQWRKANISDPKRPFAPFDHMERQTELLELSNVERLKDEVVGGADCYVLEIYSDLEKCYKIMTNTPDDQSIPSGIDIESIMEDWKITHWIDKDTHLLMKAYNQITMNFGGSPISGYTLETEILFSEYNKPVTIKLPDDANNAEWISDFTYP